jgi:formylglycine-generating enzyme required for sulfatase activity/tRNA A-37 threonylcarbamoyl transferase component Bud32
MQDGEPSTESLSRHDMHGSGDEQSSREQEALCDFLEQWHEDYASGAELDLVYYLARFPDAQAAIAREFLRLTTAPPAEERPAEVVSGDGGAQRYARLGEIARGGMGVIERVRDERLGRDLAMKSALRSGANAALRFEKEARLTGQLDHPGIVPVHDLGASPEGTPWFTMRLIGGRDLREIIQLVHQGDPSWSLTTALGVLLRVCETLAYAHSRGVVHRDLKPANVRVGQYGEVYVMDWGLARAEHLPEVHDLRLRVDGDGDDTRGSLLLTMDGDVVGTPCNMSPEQAAGKLDEVGPRSDVYSVGSMLYELLSGRMPYVGHGESVSSKVVLARVLSAPPVRLATIAPDAPAELIAVCEKAMHRDPARRYTDMRDMAADVRAYLEGRVVRAYRTGVRAEAWKWVARNKRLAWAIGAGLAVALAALGALARVEAQNRQRLRLQADARAPADLVARAAKLTTGVPDDAPALQEWLGEARELLAHIPAYERELASLRARALPWDQNAARERAAADLRVVWIEGYDRLESYYEVELAAMRAEGRPSEEGLSEAEVVERLENVRRDRASYGARPIERLTYDFARRSDADRHAMIERLLGDVAPMLGDPELGNDGLVTLMEQRLVEVSTLEQRSLRDGAEAWERAITSIADPAECPRYAGLVIRPQMGLLPLRRDAGSGLWEFLHVASGGPPRAGDTEALAEDNGIVLVLIPSARVDLGAQSLDTTRPGYDPDAQPSEWTVGPDGPVLLHAILAPFFIGKHEVTQAQWRRIAGRSPSGYTRAAYPAHVRSTLHPAESIDWHAAREALSAVGLTLPTEAQWEYAARAGTTTPWWTGSARDSLWRAANLADVRYAAHRREVRADAINAEAYDDGFALHAPVGSFAPNTFGLHDVCGNVNEWVLDAGFIGYDKPHEVLLDTFERRLWGEGLRVRRGGSFEQRATAARSAARQFNGPEYKGRDTGVRAARGLQR